MMFAAPLERAIARVGGVADGAPVIVDGVGIRLAGIGAGLSPLLAGDVAHGGRRGHGGGGRPRSRGGTPCGGFAPWGCGRSVQTARMEYTATSFAEPLQRVFDDVLHPEIDIEVGHRAESRHYVESISYRVETSDEFEQRLYEPILRARAALGRHGEDVAQRQRPPLPRVLARRDVGGAGGVAMTSVSPWRSLQAAFVIAVSPLVVGLMRKVRARLEGRIGAPISQPWRDLRKLGRKQRMVSEHTSWVFSVAPIVLAASSLTIAAIVPSLSTVTALTQVGDLFTVAYLLLLGTVFLALAGLDTATAFGGMGASRAMTVAAISEPTILVSIFALSVTAGSSNLGAIVTTTLDHPASALSPASLLAFAALARGGRRRVGPDPGRQPGDAPRAHDDPRGDDARRVGPRSRTRRAVGPRADGGAVRSARQPVRAVGHRHQRRAADSIALAVVAVIAKIVCLAVAIAAGEVFLAKLRIFRVPELLAASFVLAFLAVTASFFLQVPT